MLEFSLIWKVWSFIVDAHFAVWRNFHMRPWGTEMVVNCVMSHWAPVGEDNDAADARGMLRNVPSAVWSTPILAHQCGRRILLSAYTAPGITRWHLYCWVRVPSQDQSCLSMFLQRHCIVAAVNCCLKWLVLMFNACWLLKLQWRSRCRIVACKVFELADKT